MTSRERRRLQKVLTKIDTVDWCKVQLEDDSIFKWVAHIDGPPGTGYENYVFEVHLDLTGTYVGVHDPTIFDLEKDGALVILEETNSSSKFGCTWIIC